MRPLLRSRALQSLSWCSARTKYFSRSFPHLDALTAPSSGLLIQLRNDLKLAMRAKNTPRLAVIRALLSDVSNSSKTSAPITTDIQVVSTVRRRIAAGEHAAQQFREAGRQDLVTKEESQIAVLKEYAAAVQTTGTDEIIAAVRTTMEALKNDGEKINLGAVMKIIMGERGELNGKPVEKKDVVNAIKGMLPSN